MKKFIILSLILFLISFAASAQMRNTNVFRRNLQTQRFNDIRLMNSGQFRHRTNNARIQLAREKILKNPDLSSRQKRKLYKNRLTKRQKMLLRKHRYLII